MATADQLEAYSTELYEALRARKTIVPLSTRSPELNIDDAYHISLGFLQKRLNDGEKVIGKKIGVTSKPVQDMLNVRQPDFGFLTDVMEIPDGGTAVIADGLIQPRAEAEIAFMLKKDLKGPGVSMQDVLDATDYIMPCFEIVDSRIADWKLTLPDTVADNASSGAVVLGDWVPYGDGIDLPSARASLWLNGTEIDSGVGSAVMGDPAAAVAWLANALARFGTEILAGQFIMSGSFTTAAFIRPGDVAATIVSGVGAVSLSFT